MGVVKVENMDPDTEVHDKVQDVSNRIDIISQPGIYLFHVLFTVNVLCFAFLMVRLYSGTRKGIYKHPVCNHIKVYVQKLSLMNFLSGLLSFLLAYWLISMVGIKEDKQSKCFTIGDAKYMALLILMYTMGVCYIRYIAFGLASSEAQSAPGGDPGNSDVRQNPKPDVLIGFNSQKSPIFLTPLRAYLLLGLLCLLTTTYLLFGPLPSPLQTILFHWSYCIPSEMVNNWYRFIVFCCCTLLFNVVIILTEKVLRQPLVSDGRGVLYMTPFTVTTAGTTSSCWMFLLAFMVFWLNLGAVEIILVWSLCSCLDAVWSVILGLSIPLPNISGSRV